MREKHRSLVEGQKTRFVAARNHFKHMVLQGLHIANSPQTMSLLRELADMDSLIGDRTWQSWFSSRPPFPQPSKIKCLDQYITQIKMCGQVKRADSICPEFRDGYFCELVHGGLMAQMLATTEASNPVRMLMRRAQEYQPVSPLHLHFDAMDAAGWHQDYGDVPWPVVAAIAADRVLQLLDDRWSPRSGSVYSGFCSDLSLKWAVADEQQRGEIRRSLAKMRPDLGVSVVSLTRDALIQERNDLDVKEWHREKCLAYISTNSECSRLGFTRQNYRSFRWLLHHDRPWLDCRLPVPKQGMEQLSLF